MRLQSLTLNEESGRSYKYPPTFSMECLGGGVLILIPLLKELSLIRAM